MAQHAEPSIALAQAEDDIGAAALATELAARRPSVTDTTAP
ncbi:hypothetical protein [Streptomyces sp. ISL-86]|nr:hypothetical protein [Streptomyces sp. ISL-86]